ncbi:hypothetical protein WJX81_005298 [Elliptochloris bilobata]|uniref:PUM-HD domain-containing protein n=1 Tax=Elliptochloris bilobata TaxID=381761 RepID=A0AAW1QJ05_9CHLO
MTNSGSVHTSPRKDLGAKTLGATIVKKYLASPKEALCVPPSCDSPLNILAEATTPRLSVLCMHQNGSAMEPEGASRMQAQAQLQALRLPHSPQHAQPHAPQHAITYPQHYGGAFDPATPAWHHGQRFGEHTAYPLQGMAPYATSHNLPVPYGYYPQGAPHSQAAVSPTLATHMPQMWHWNGVSMSPVLVMNSQMTYDASMYGGAHGVHGMQAVAGSPPMAPYMGSQGFHPAPRPAPYGGMAVGAALDTPAIAVPAGFTRAANASRLSSSRSGSGSFGSGGSNQWLDHVDSAARAGAGATLPIGGAGGLRRNTAGAADTTRPAPARGGELGRRGSGHRRMRSDDSARGRDFTGRVGDLLEEIKASGRIDLQRLKGAVFDLCRDQHGSRYVQTRLETAPDEEVDWLFREVGGREQLSALAQDPFGNFTLQKLLERGSPQLRAALAAAVAGDVEAHTRHMYGCRVLQKLLEVEPEEGIEEDGRVALVEELRGRVLACVADQNGNHVIQKIIERVPSHRVRFVLDEVLVPGAADTPVTAVTGGPGSELRAGVVPMSRHPYGCRVIQRILEHCTLPDVKESVKLQAQDNALDLARDVYGNYISQHLLIHGSTADRDTMVARVMGCVVELSMHKFSSNLIEKCLLYGSPAQRDAMVAEMLAPPGGNPNPGASDAPADEAAVALNDMVRDQYANFCVGRAIEVCTPERRQQLLDCVRKHLAALKRTPCGKHICARVEKLLDASRLQQLEHSVQAAGAEGGAGPWTPPAAAAQSAAAAPFND